MTAPQQTAPDADEGIVAALAEDCPCGHMALRHNLGGCEYRALPHDCPCRVPVLTALERLIAPTVARLIEDAVAERLAGVEALADEFRRLDYSWDGQTGEPLIPLSHLLAALHPEVETSRQTPRNGPRSDDGAIGGVPGRSDSGEAASEETR